MSSTVTPPSSSIWQRRVVAPLRTQLMQGATPDKMALTIAVGTACSLVPFLGFTTVVNLIVGAWLRLNHPVMQAVNYVLGPVQLVLIVVYVRLGEKIWHAPPVPFSIPTLIAAFRNDPWGFLQRFGWTGVHATTAWLISVPFLIAVVYFPLLPVFRRLAARRAAR